MIIHHNQFRIAAEELLSPFQHFRGLMFYRKLKSQEGLFFIFDKPRHIDIHMLFVFQSLDAVWMDRKGTILSIKRNIKPFTPFIKGTRATSLLETAAFSTLSLKIGDKVKFKRA